ncbi:DUF4382 domain-containing protein [Pleionea litopenaei]|uniref:DUF4382 domain-containing protein n=1 Tax=Pleionea litopenaei TaxID=3070815 RepID=A0AA51RRC1_9GAMM|nr:DUF4382 domain-containing protein [Pleionea sp. HL-JVS1]WMS86113.1 DUF4382 domain-containing protein [Pleionea sp. HL-JVS1]
MKTIAKHSLLLSSMVSALILVGCDSSDKNNGTISLKLTDAPVDSATEVVVEFTGVEIKPTEGAALQFDFDEPRQIDLLALQNGATEPLLTQEVVTAGSYNWVRLKVNADNQVMDSYISFEGGETYSLYVPSGSQSGLKLNQGFNVAIGQDADFTIDFDLRKSIVDPQSNQVDYLLKPSLRIIDNTEIGEISGSVANATMEQASCIDGGVVYLFQDADTPPDDMGSESPPLSSANVTYNDSENTYEFMFAFVAPGEYTLSLTCDAQNDDPEADDSITFIESLNATVETDMVTDVDFN